MTDLDLTADMNLSLDLTEFEPEQFAIAQAAAVQRQRQAVAYRTHSRRMARRAASDAHLAEILPLDIVPGDAWHVISQGDVDALSYLAHLLKSGPSTTSRSPPGAWRKPTLSNCATGCSPAPSGVSMPTSAKYSPGNTPANTKHSAPQYAAQGGGRVCVTRNHAKLFLCRRGALAWVVESSANINTNPRMENTVITADYGLYQHHKTYLDGLRSFARDFDRWTPAP